MEAALLEGASIVVDKDIDVFAVASEKGNLTLLMPIYTVVTTGID